MRSRFTNNTKNSIKTINQNRIAPAKLKNYYEILFDNKLKMNYTNTTINERELFIMNHKGWLYGTLYDDFASADHLMYRFTFRNPKGIILGDLSKTDLFYNYHNDKRNYYLGLKLHNINNENLIARQEMMEYFKKDFQNSLLFFKQHNDYICALADFKNNLKIFDPNLSASYYACYHDNIKLFYGGNAKILLEEDLAINMELSELQKCYVESIDKYKLLAKYNCFNPCMNLVDFNIHFKNVVQANNAELLFDKKCQYSASVFRKIHEIYDENLFLMPNNLVDLTYSYAVDSLCPDFNKIFRNKQFIKKISEMESNEKNLEEIIEKIVIINLLCHDEFKIFLHSGINPLKDLFLGLFQDISFEKVLEMYKKYYYIYCEPLMENFVEDLNRLETNETEGRKFLKFYNEEIKEIEKEDRNEILIDKYTLEKYMLFGTQLILMQINNNIRKRELKGENLISTKLALKKLFVNGIKTKQILDTYNELFAEANAQLNIFKLPKSFIKFEKKIKDTLLENYKELIGENFEETCYEAMKKVQQDIYELNMNEKIIKTGPEPELTLSDMKSNKNKIDFFKQSKIMDNIMNDLSNDKFKNIQKLRNEYSAINNQKKSSIHDVSIEELENEICRLRKKLGIETQEEYFEDDEKKHLNIDKLKKKVKQIKSEKFKSITDFNAFNNEEQNDNMRIIQNEIKNISGENLLMKDNNDTQNVGFFSKNNNNENSSSEVSISESEDHKALKRLEIIRDIKLGFKEELENELQNNAFSELNPATFFNLDIFVGKTLEELKLMEVEELHESETKLSSDGSMNINEVQIGDSFYKYAQTNALKNSSVIDLSTQQAELNFHTAFDSIKDELVKKDNIRAERIITALENGHYIDDPFYVTLLMKSNKYLKLREKFLKKYFRDGNNDEQNHFFSSNENYKISRNKSNAIKNKNDNDINKELNLFETKTTLLDKYIKKPGNIVDNMLADGVFQKYETDIGKVYVSLLKDYVNDLDAEEEITEKNLNLEEYHNSDLKDMDNGNSNFNVYELNKKLSNEYDDYDVSKEDIEKELGLKKVNKLIVKDENELKDNQMLITNNKKNENFLTQNLGEKINVYNGEDYVPGSKRGFIKKKFKKIADK